MGAGQVDHLTLTRIPEAPATPAWGPSPPNNNNNHDNNPARVRRHGEASSQKFKPGLHRRRAGRPEPEGARGEVGGWGGTPATMQGPGPAATALQGLRARTSPASRALAGLIGAGWALQAASGDARRMLLLVPAKSIIRVWVFVTASFVEPSLVSTLCSAISLLALAAALEVSAPARWRPRPRCRWGEGGGGDRD